MRLSEWALRRYPEGDHVTRLKARILLYVAAVLLVVLPLFIALTVALNLGSVEMRSHVNWPVIGVMGGGWLGLMGVVWLLQRGRFGAAGHGFMNLALGVVWGVILTDRSSGLTRLDTVVFIPALLGTLPLALARRRWVVALYVGGNVLALALFVWLLRDGLGVTPDALGSYFADVVFAMLISGLAGWAVFGINRDALERAREEVEARRRAEEKTSYQYALLVAQSEASSDGILFVDLEGRVVHSNRRFAQLWGLSEDELATRFSPRLREAVSQKVREPEAFLSRVGELYRQPEVVSDDEVEMVDGRTLERHSEPVRAATGEVLGRVWYFRDVTARKEAERAIRASRELYRQILSSITSVFWKAGVDEKGALSRGYISEAVDGLLGLAPGTIGDDFPRFFSYIHPEDLPGVEATLQESLATPGKRTSCEYRVRRPDGTERRLVSSGVAVRGPDGALEVYGTTDDVTEARKARAATQALEERLRQAEKMESIGRLAGGIAHDFNNLLTALVGNLELARLETPEGPEPFLKEASRAAESAAGLTRQLLAFSRKQVIEPQVLDLNAAVTQTAKMLQRLLGEDVVLRADGLRAQGRVRADPAQLETILVNLAVNARDAMPGGGQLTLETADVVLDEAYCAGRPEARPGAYVLLAVSDTGQGMSEEVQRHLFEPFFTTKPKGKGTGLGLATIYGVVTQNGGHVAVYSAPGQGTTFKVYLPSVVAEAAAGERPAASRLPFGNERLLLVEDEEQVRQFALTVLTRQGYRVQAFASGEEALAQVGDDLAGIPLLVTDVVLTGMNGRRLADALRERHPALEVLFTSGYTGDVMVHHGVLEAGLNFLGKPYTAGALARKVRQILDGEGA